MTGLPAGRSKHRPDSGVISGDITVGADNGSPYTVTAADGAASAQQTFHWTISHFSIANPGDQTNAVGDSVDVSTGGSDPDGDALTFSAPILPPGLQIDPASGDITGTITGTASDGTHSNSNLNGEWRRFILRPSRSPRPLGTSTARCYGQFTATASIAAALRRRFYRRRKLDRGETARAAGSGRGMGGAVDEGRWQERRGLSDAVDQPAAEGGDQEY
jgi:hypothetical protein